MKKTDRCTAHCVINAMRVRPQGLQGWILEELTSAGQEGLLRQQEPPTKAQRRD